MNKDIFLGVVSKEGAKLIAYKRDGKYFMKLDEETEISRGFYEAIRSEYDENARTNLDCL